MACSVSSSSEKKIRLMIILGAQVTTKVVEEVHHTVIRKEETYIIPLDMEVVKVTIETITATKEIPLQ